MLANLDRVEVFDNELMLAVPTINDPIELETKKDVEKYLINGLSRLLEPVAEAMSKNSMISFDNDDMKRLLGDVVNTLTKNVET